MLKSRSLVALPLVAAALMLTACTAAPSAKPTAAANDKEAAKFVACLIDQGQTAKILDGGMVGMLSPEQPDHTGGMTQSNSGGNGPTSFVAMFEDDDGVWIAAGDADAFPEDGGMQDAWTACHEQLPDFTQPEPDFSGGDGDKHVVNREDAIKASLAFAKCARENGYADFEDPDKDGQITLPSGFTEETFRALMDACNDTLTGMGLPISKESADALDFDWLSVMSDYIKGPVGGTGPAGGSGPHAKTGGDK